MNGSLYIIGVGDQVWLALITVMGGLFGTIVTFMLETMRRRQVAADKKVEQVKVDLKESSEKTDTKLDVVVAKVEEVHLATNSMKDQLVAKTEAEGLARGREEGRVQEKNRADGLGS